MKVLGIIHSPNYADSTVKKHYQVTKFFGDTFEKTEKSDNPAFKANPKPIINSLQEGAQKVLNNPELIQKSFPAFLAAAFAAMIDLANGKETNTDDNAAQIAAKEFIKSEIEKTSEITEQTKDEISAKRYIELPRRHGTLSKQENYLRETAAKISDISEESERNLQEIWQRLISKGYESDEQRKAASKEDLILRKKQSNILSENIANELSQNIGDTQKIEDIISNYYDKVFANKETLPSKELETPAIETDSSIQDEVEELVAAEPEITLVNKDELTLEYVYPGTLNDQFHTNLNSFWNSFKYKVAHEVLTDQKIIWKDSYPIRFVVNEHNVIEELQSKHGSDRYRNIKPIIAEEVADVINNEPRFRKYFKLHSAMRLIDRFVDFNNEVDTQTQVTNILNKLEKLIESEFKKKAKVKIYKDINDEISATLVIDLSKAEDEFQKIFGTTTLNIGICKIKDKRFYQEDKCMINTIVAKGVSRD